MESSPRFKTTVSSPPAAKLRLMCSNGGHIIPRPHDKTLCYVGGETRMVAVDRHTTLLDLTHRLSKTIFRSTATSAPAPSLFTLKYQLPSEDLDSLISVTTDEDLENMIDECERLSFQNSSSRLRLFVFPTNPEPVSSMGSFLENPSKSEDWFLNALNGTVSGFSDTSSSVTCLLDLNGDEINLPEKKDAHSFPDSPMMETTSSFGSASSTPSNNNLPAVRVNAPEDCLKVAGGGIEKQFSHLNMGLTGSPAPVAVSGSPAMDPFISFVERSEVGDLKQQQQQQHQQQEQSTGFDKVSRDLILSDLTITDQSSPTTQIQSSSFNNQSDDPIDSHVQNTIFQMLQQQQQQQQKVHNPAYLSSMPTAQVGSPRHQLPQFIPPLQYIHHHHPSVAVPVTSYYQHHPPTDQQNFMYYIPTRQPPQGYTFPLQQPQPSHSDPPPAAATKTELPAGVYRTTSSGAPQLVRVPSGYQNQPIYYATP